MLTLQDGTAVKRVSHIIYLLTFLSCNLSFFKLILNYSMIAKMQPLTLLFANHYIFLKQEPRLPTVVKISLH